jgi:hypothetical protein
MAIFLNPFLGRSIKLSSRSTAIRHLALSNKSSAGKVKTGTVTNSKNGLFASLKRLSLIEKLVPQPAFHGHATESGKDVKGLRLTCPRRIHGRFKSEKHNLSNNTGRNS